MPLRILTNWETKTHLSPLRLTSPLKNKQTEISLLPQAKQMMSLIIYFVYFKRKKDYGQIISIKEKKIEIVKEGQSQAVNRGGGKRKRKRKIMLENQS